MRRLATLWTLPADRPGLTFATSRAILCTRTADQTFVVLLARRRDGDLVLAEARLRLEWLFQ